MNTRGWAWMVAIAGFAVLVAGCGSSKRTVTAYEPGVYKGATDELLEAHGTPESKAKLRERFTKGQADR